MACNEMTLLFEKHFKDPELGVNALADQVPRGTDTAPRAVTIYSDLSSEEIAENKDPPSVPALVVVADVGAESTAKQGRTQQRVRNVILGVGYVDSDTVILLAKIDSGLVLRGLQASVLKLLQKGVKERTVNGVTLLQVTKMVEQRASGVIGTSRLTGFVLIHCEVQERFSV